MLVLKENEVLSGGLVCFDPVGVPVRKSRSVSVHNERAALSKLAPESSRPQFTFTRHARVILVVIMPIKQGSTMRSTSELSDPVTAEPRNSKPSASSGKYRSSDGFYLVAVVCSGRRTRQTRFSQRSAIWEFPI